MYIFSGKKHFRMCAKTSLVFISALAWSVPGCVGATSDNPPLYTSCWRWTWSLFSPAATPSDDWRGRISWKIATHAAACYIQNMLWIMISRVGVGEGLGWLYSIHVSLIVKKISREDQRWIDPTNEMYVIPPVPYISIVVILSVKHTVSLLRWTQLIPFIRQIRIDPQLETVPNRFLGKSQSAEEDRVKSWKLQEKKKL